MTALKSNRLFLVGHSGSSELVVLFLSFAVSVCCTRGFSSAGELPSFTHPQRVFVPDDIPFVTTQRYRDKEGTLTEVLVMAAIEYQRGHYDGWQSALARAEDASDKRLGDIAEWVAPVPSSPNSYYCEGINAGFVKCSRFIEQSLRQGVEPSVIREACRRSHSPTEPPAPLPRDGDLSPSKSRSGRGKLVR